MMDSSPAVNRPQPDTCPHRQRFTVAAASIHQQLVKATTRLSSLSTRPDLTRVPLEMSRGPGKRNATSQGIGTSADRLLAELDLLLGSNSVFEHPADDEILAIGPNERLDPIATLFLASRTELPDEYGSGVYEGLVFSQKQLGIQDFVGTRTLPSGLVIARLDRIERNPENHRDMLRKELRERIATPNEREPGDQDALYVMRGQLAVARPFQRNENRELFNYTTVNGQEVRQEHKAGEDWLGTAKSPA